MKAKGKYAQCPKCKTKYSAPRDGGKPGNCTVCLMDRVELVELVMVDHGK